MVEANIAGRYEVLNEIGRGGMGRVVRARDNRLQRLVAIKLVPLSDDFDFLERLGREAKTIALLTHNNIVNIYDVGQFEDSAYIVMEYVPGHTLESDLRKTPGVPRADLLPILSDCAQALDFAHRRGVVHRDIKPSNIMIREDGVGKILDFGIARVVADNTSAVTQEGMIVGTLSYMPPEQAYGQPVSGATDEYALGVIAWRLLTGRLPFEAESTMALLSQIVSKEPPKPSSVNADLSPEVDAVLLRALSKDPNLRFAQCSEFMRDLQFGLGESLSGTTRSAKTGYFRTLLSTVFSMKRGATEKPKTSSEPATPAAPATGPAEPVTGPNVPRAAPPPGPGEFTQMFQAAEQTLILRKAPEERPDPDVLARAQARELVDILQSRDFESAVLLRGKWLPGIEGAGGELLGFSEAARYLGAAQETISPHVRIEHLRRAEQVLFSIGNQLLAGDSPWSRHLPEALEAWKAFARGLLASAQQRAAVEIPNPFRAGQPLRPDQGRAVFRGREKLVRNIEAILADADQSSSLALLGPRRCGKTSLLQMLPALLPDCACVFFDLQDNPVSTVPEFFEALVRRAREQVGHYMKVNVPSLEKGGTFESAGRWFQELDSIAEVKRWLICIDEFERLKDLFPGDESDLLRLMGLFRAVIQHRRKVRLLVSGVAPFEELGRVWNDHFINVRELRIGPLDEDTSVDLLTRPIPDFPAETVPREVAQGIHQRTGGQPYLLQLYGALLVNLLNQNERSVAELRDVQCIEEEALSQGRYYFSNTYHDAPEEARLALAALARGEQPEIAPSTRRWLSRRCLINGDGHLRIPVLGAFIEEELAS